MDAVILVDVLDAHGNMISRQRMPLASPGPPLVIGRDVACDIVVNDPYAAARHAELSLNDDGTVRVRDLDTINGLILQGERVRQATLAGLRNNEFQIGHSHLRIRASTDPLPPERLDLESLRSRHREFGVLVAGALLCAGFALFTAWVGSPDNLQLSIATNLLLGSMALGVWFVFWVLLGRAIRSRWQWLRNAAVTLGAAAAALWVKWATDVAAFATGMPLMKQLGALLCVLIVGVAIYLHVRIASRWRTPPAVAMASLIPLIGFATYLWVMSQRHEEDVNYIAPPGGIYPPSWSHQNGIRPEKFFEEILELRDVADQKVAEDRLLARP